MYSKLVTTVPPIVLVACSSIIVPEVGTVIAMVVVPLPETAGLVPNTTLPDTFLMRNVALIAPVYVTIALEMVVHTLLPGYMKT